MDDFISLGFLVNRAAAALSRSMNAALNSAQIDLPHSQFIVLRCLYYKSDLSQLEIAHLLSKDAAAIKRTLDNLEQKGLVVRKNVRTLKNSVNITDKGREIMPEVLRIADIVTDKALRNMTDETREVLRSLLDDIYNNLK